MEFSIDTTSRLPIGRQLADQIREAIARGRLKPEQRLPSVRDMSRTLVVNPNTVARVYGELEQAGVLTTRPGLGVFVAKLGSDLSLKVRQKRLQDATDRLLTEAVHLGFSSQEVQSLIADRMLRFRWSDKER